MFAAAFGPAQHGGAWKTSDSNDQDVPSDSDGEVLQEAVRVGGHLFREDELRDHWLK